MKKRKIKLLFMCTWDPNDRKRPEEPNPLGGSWPRRNGLQNRNGAVATVRVIDYEWDWEKVRLVPIDRLLVLARAQRICTRLAEKKVSAPKPLRYLLSRRAV